VHVEAALSFAGREGSDDIAIICRNTTEAINHLAYRLRLRPDDVVVTSVVEHHSNLLPWSRVAKRRYVECRSDGTFAAGDVAAELDRLPKPRLLTITGASNVTGWLPPIEEIIDASHRRGVPVAVDCAQLAPHRPLPPRADFVAWSGHKMYAPFGAGVLIGPREAFADGDPFLAGGGSVNLVELDDVTWTDPPDREEAGSPNVVGAVRCTLRSTASPRWAGRRSSPTTAISATSCAMGWRPSRECTSSAGPPDRHPARCGLHRGRSLARPRGGPTVGRGRNRRAARLLLRTSLHDAASRPHR